MKAESKMKKAERNIHTEKTKTHESNNEKKEEKRCDMFVQKVHGID